MTDMPDFFAKTLQGNGHVIEGPNRHAVTYYILWKHEGEMLGRVYSDMATLQMLSERTELALEIEDGRQVSVSVGEPYLDALAEADLTFPRGAGNLTD